MRIGWNSPFSPGADAVPQIWAGREEQLNDWHNIVRPRRLHGLPERGRTILGEPGLGKSALVRRIAQDAAANGDWVTPQIRIPLGADPLKNVAKAVLGLADQAGLPSSREKRIRETIACVRAVEVSGISLTIDKATGPEPHESLRELLVDVGRAAIKANTMALIHIDEVQNLKNPQALSQLLIALGDTLAHEEAITAPGGATLPVYLPIAVYLTGLPGFEDVAGSSQGATFARRFQKTLLEPISDEDLRAALHPLITHGWPSTDENGDPTRIYCTPEAADLIITLGQGDPFLFQLAGDKAWCAGTSETITKQDVRTGWEVASHEATAHVERILEQLPPRENEFLRAMASVPPNERNFTRIVEKIGHEKASSAGPAAQRLDTVRGIIKRGKPYTFRHRAVEAYLTTNWPNITP